MRILGGILAGGRGLRMTGFDKPLAPLAGRPLIAHVIERLAPQVDDLVINANGAPARFTEFGRDIVADRIGGRQGPLAGIHALLQEAGRRDAARVLIAPADTPFLPGDLGSRLGDIAPEADDARIAVCGGRRHPVVGLWPAYLADDLAGYLAQTDDLSMAGYLRRIGAREVPFTPAPGTDPFFNVNAPEDLERAERLLRAR